MPRRLLFALSLLFMPLASLGAQTPETPSRAQLEFFEKSVRPVLADNCFSCHGPDKQKGGLRLDSRPNMMAGGDTGAAIIAGQPENSLLMKAIHYKDEDFKMPPKGQLKPAEIAALTTWIKMGAPWPQAAGIVRPAAKESTFKITAEDRAFWSFQPVADPPLPVVQNKDWPKTAIDHFILAKLEENKLQPSPAADKRALIRRATFDLIGLPPTPAEIDAFLSDGSPEAFAKVVDRLLASPHYGERWARHWLDLARYGEDQAHTFQARKYPQGFRYRDWLIKAFNDDMPYDRFVKEQIAADLLDGPDRVENLPALGFFSLGPVYYGDPKKLDQIDDRIDTLTRGIMGLTVACARCHDHKYDPIATKDYYALAGVFNSTDYIEISLDPGQEGKELKPGNPKDKSKDKPAPPKAFVHALKDKAQPVNLAVHIRGNPATLGEDTPRGFLSILASRVASATGDQPQVFTKGSGRLELARAVASKDNPLTPRVIVNRIWRHHFGKGLVRTTSNFGQLGERPTHSELLDHLTARFIAPPLYKGGLGGGGWSIKKLHRDIMLSAVYQQSSRVDSPPQPTLLKGGNPSDIDPDNKLLWRMNRQRLEVEAWRDAMLAVAGTLDPKLGGPSTDLNAPDNKRRTLYGNVSRHELNPLLRLFDFPDPNITSDERPHTTVPLQQLFVLNSEFMVRNAKALVARLDAKADNAARVRQAFVLLYARPATERDLQLGLAFLNQDTPAAGIGLTRWEQYAQVLLSANEFMYVD